MNLIVQSHAGSDVDRRTPVSQRRSILSVNATSCRWPIGDPRSAGFYLCGGPTNGKTPYCDRHAQAAVRPTAAAAIKWKLV
jgi:GcrA cell cycle regulator